MAVVLGTITYKDGTGTPVTVQAYINNTPVPNVVFPGGTLFDHLGNVLTVDIGAGVGAVKATLMTMPQVIGSVAHDSPDTQPPVKIGGYGSAALRTAVTEADRTDASFDLQGQLRTLPQGALAHDAADAGNPLKIGGRASTGLRTVVADNDRVDGLFDDDGALVLRLAPHALLVSGNASNTDGTATELIAAGAAGVRTYLTGVTITNTHATTFGYVEIKDGSTVKHTIPAPPAAGATVYFDPPLRGTAATAWNFDPSAAITTIITSAVGYQSKS